MEGKELIEAAVLLQRRLALIDMSTSTSSGDHASFLVLKIRSLAITMDGDRRHPRPHVHVNYRKQKHAASFAIDNGERLDNGKIGKKYDEDIGKWILEKQEQLFEIWHTVQSGQCASVMIADLQGEPEAFERIGRGKF